MSPLMGWSDWSMILGAMMTNAGMSTVVVAGFNDAGRLLSDPFWQPDAVEKMVYQNHLTFIAQLLNVYGMWVIKMSICAYLLALNFSKEYRWVVWGTIVFAKVFNFLLPVTQHFGLCRPLASRWDMRITDKKCWPQIVRIGIACTQAISNIVTDLVYATAPIAYLRSVQLSRRTQWSVRAVFLMSLACTTISCFKLWDFQRIQGKQEVYYESVTLSIWSMVEVSIGIVVANLPPFRKSFDSLLRHVMSGSVTSKLFSGNRSSNSNKNSQSFKLPMHRIQPNRKSTMDGITGRSERTHSMATATVDKTADRTMVGKPQEKGRRNSDGIMCTTHVSVDRESLEESDKR